MCGIFGYIKFDSKNKKSLTREQIDEAFEESMYRGREATGFFTPITGTVKDHESADEFCKRYRKRIVKALESPVFIAHTRTATYGFRNGVSSFMDNDNNHPHEGKRFVLVHNGHFSHLPQVKNYPYKGNCDSELALSYVETFGIKRGLELMSEDDKFSLLIYDKKENKLFFFREDNPLTYLVNYETGMVVFGSTVDIVLTLTSDKDSGAGLIVGNASPAYSTYEKRLYTLEIGKGVVSQQEIKIRTNDYGLRDIPEAKQLDLVEEPKREIYSRNSNVGFVKGETISRHSTYRYDTRRLEVFVALDRGVPMYYKIHDNTLPTKARVTQSEGAFIN